jgi:hypothetical protein
MSPFGLVIVRLAYPDPAAVVVVFTLSAPTNRSFAFFVVADPLLAEVPLPCAAATTSTGDAVAMPLYSAMRISGKDTAVLNVTVTVFAFAAAGAMPLA